MATLPPSAYHAAVGQEITFDGSGSRSDAGPLLTYEWDFDGDNMYDDSSTSPIAKLTYNEAFRGMMHLLVTDAAGHTAKASAEVNTGGPYPWEGRPPAPDAVRVTPISTTAGTTTIRVTWTSNNPDIYRWGFTVNGIPVGMAEGSVRTTTISEVQRGKDVEIGIVGFKDGTMGVPKTFILPAAPAK